MRPTRLHALLFSSMVALCAVPAQAQVVISQVYGGGGNSGAPLKSDFVELFNAGAAPVDITGWTVQYASSSGTSWQATALSGTIPAGGYYLVKQADGAGTQPALPTPDAIGTLSMAGGSGKVALSNSSAALSGACPTAVDLVPYGSANCPSPTGGLGNATAALRKGGGCTITGAATDDFEILAPAPRNSATTANPCGGGTDPTNPTGTGSASPATLADGETTLLTVSVIPGTNPASTGITVQADLTDIGGSATQALRDDGTQGDLVADDLVFSWQGMVDAAGPGVVSLPVAIADEQARTGSASIGLSVVAEATIAQIQGTGVGSPLPVGTEVVTEGIVTALRANGYFIQSAIGEEDNDDATAEGVFVFTNVAPPAEAVVGNRVRVGARVSSFSRTPHGYPLTQLSFASATVLATNQPLPPEVTLDATVLSADSPLDALGRYQGMRVALPAATVVGATNGFGDFHVTLPETDRPFREPGIAALDAVPLPPGNAIPRFDRNPERLRVESTGLVGGLPFNVDAGTTIEGMSGVMYYDRGDFTLLIGDSSGLVTSGGGTVAAVPVADPGAFRIGSYNIENLSGGASVPVNRLSKLNEVFCQYLRLPDVVGLVEIANLATLQRLADSINSDEFGFCPDSPQYDAFLLSNSGSQRLGYLVSTAPTPAGAPRVEVIDVTQVFTAEPLVAPDGSTTGGVLFDRAPLRLDARINGANGEAYPVTVLLNHTLSLLDVNDLATRSDSWQTQGNRSRGKRLQQAVKLSELVESIQVADPDHALVLIGDYNAFEFSDGYVDVMGIISGQPAPEGTVLNWADSALTTPLLNLTTTLPQATRYSYVFEGNTQTLDHALVNEAVLETTEARLYHARVNADFALDNAADVGVPLRTSDHDPLVVDLSVPRFLDSDLDVELRTADGRNAYKPDQAVGFQVDIANLGPDRAVDAELELRITAEPDQVTPVQFAGWICADPVADGRDSLVYCGRELALEAGQAESLPLVVQSVRDQSREYLRVNATLFTRSREQSTGNDDDMLQVGIAGKGSRLHGLRGR